MKISENFDSKEWLDNDVLNFCKMYGYSHTWYINPRLVSLAEFYREFFSTYFCAMDNSVSHVEVVINKSGTGGRGLRSPMYSGKGAKMSQHKFLQAFDCDINIVFRDGRKQEADYSLIHGIILDYEKEFMAAGLTTLESVEKAKTWLHSDIRWIPGQEHIKIV